MSRINRKDIESNTPPEETDSLIAHPKPKVSGTRLVLGSFYQASNLSFPQTIAQAGGRMRLASGFAIAAFPVGVIWNAVDIHAQRSFTQALPTPRRVLISGLRGMSQALTSAWLGLILCADAVNLFMQADDPCAIIEISWNKFGIMIAIAGCIGILSAIPTVIRDYALISGNNFIPGRFYKVTDAISESINTFEATFSTTLTIQDLSVPATSRCLLARQCRFFPSLAFATVRAGISIGKEFDPANPCLKIITDGLKQTDKILHDNRNEILGVVFVISLAYYIKSLADNPAQATPWIVLALTIATTVGSSIFTACFNYYQNEITYEDETSDDDSGSELDTSVNNDADPKSNLNTGPK